MYLVVMQPVDLVIKARWIIPVEPDGVVLDHHSVAVDRGRIVAVYPSELDAYRPAGTVELPHHALFPGLVNAHTHAAMTLLRGYADDLPLKRWLEEHIWPAEAKWANAEFVRVGTELAIAEMLSGGVTCFNDMYFFPDVAARCVEAGHIRARIGLIMLDMPTAWARDPEEYLSKGIAVHDAVRHSSLVTTAFAPHAPYTVSDAPLRRIRVLADELDIPIHLHLHETAHEIEQSMARYGVRPLERLGQLGLLGPRLQAVHMTQLLPAEIAALAEYGVHVVHCPESNLKLGSGVCPVSALAAAGVNIALGTDSAASNNDLDMLGEMRSAAMLAKGTTHDPTALPARQVLRMATLGGARALSLDHDIGSLLPGKCADLVAIDLSDLRTQPVYDPVAQIVYSAGRDQVSHVWVDGRPVVQEATLLTLDRRSILQRVQNMAQRISASSAPGSGTP